MKLFKKVSHYFEHSDLRGSIVGLINFGVWREVNLIESEAGTFRGFHYHKSTKECFIIISGKILVKLRMPISDKPDLIEEFICNAGDVFVVNPLVEHTFEILETAKWINMLSVPVDPKDPDFYKY